MNILAIGNSFSEDATYYLHKIAKSANVDVTVVNLFIGGCSISTHAKNILNNNANYRYELNGEYTDRLASITDALKEREWDIVTIQQRSGHSGVYETYGNDIKILIDCIKQNSPNSQIYFHQTWAYEIDSGHDDFAIYGKNQAQMYNRIKETVTRVCNENKIEKIIPSGELINEIRKNPPFDYANGGKSMCRDGFHMDLIYGRYALALLWFAVALDGDVLDATFVPSENDIINGYVVEQFECDIEKINIIKNLVLKYKNQCHIC